MFHTLEAYIGKLGKLATHCGGGHGVPLVRMMDRCAKTYGVNKTLGEELVTAVVDLHVSDFAPVVMIRVAVVLANLTADRIVDGIAKMLVRSDVDKLKALSARTTVVELDEKLNRGYTLACKLYDEGAVDIEQFDDIVCKFFTRGILHVSGKGKSGPEARVFANLGEVCSAFMTDAEKIVGEFVQIDPDDAWKPLAVSPSTAQSTTGEADVTMFTEAEQCDPVLVLRKRGFEVGQVMFEKGVGPSQGLYKLVSIGDDKVELDELKTFEPSGLKVRVQLPAFLKGWNAYKAGVPIAVPVKLTPHAHVHDTMHIDAARCKVFNAVVAFECKHSIVRKVKYAFNPSIMVVDAEYKVGELRFGPLTDLNRFKAEKHSSAAPVRVGARNLFAYPPPKASDASKMKDTVLFVPYWWVDSTDSKDVANVKLVSFTDGDVVFPIFQNTKKLSVNSRLFYFKASEPKKALSDAKRIKLNEDA